MSSSSEAFSAMKHLRDRFTEKLRNLGPQDDLDKYISGLIEKGSDPRNHAPDWTVNMQLVDVVNSAPDLTCDKLLRIINRTIAKPVVRTQVLALTMLDTCIRNCHPMLHAHLASSVLWADLLKLVQDTSVTRIDLEVRDRILAMIEDYGKYLKVPPTFAEAYENLVDQGVDFPVRSPDELVPIETYIPPVPPPSTTAAGQPAPATAAPAPAADQQPAQTGRTASRLFSNFFAGFGGGSAMENVDNATQNQVARQREHSQPPIGGGRGIGVDPSVMEGLSEEDRVAVQAAMAEMALEMQSAQEAAALAASQAQDAELQSTRAAGDTDGSNTNVSSRCNRLPEDDSDAIQVITNSVNVFSEMLGGIPDTDPAGVKEPLMRELADACSQYKSRLTEMANNSSDEGVLHSALAMNDVLGAAMSRYDALLAQALAQQTPGLPAAEADTAVRAAAATNAITGAATAVTPSAGGAFTLLDDDDDEQQAEEEELVTRRRQPAATPPVPAAPVDLMNMTDDVPPQPQQPQGNNPNADLLS